MNIPICLASDRNYIQHLSVTLASILYNKAEADLFRFYILGNDFTEEDQKKINQLKLIADFDIEYIPVREKFVNLFPITPTDRITIDAYYRLFIPDLIPGEDKVIYLDCDIVVLHSLAELYDMDIGNDYILGVRDIDSHGNRRRMGTKRYINSGVLLMNSKKMREDRIVNRFIDYILKNKARIVWHDQDVIAGALDGFVRYISPVWNGQIGRLPQDMRFSRLHEAHVLHYIGDRKPWLPYKNSAFTEEYFKYLRLTPFAGFEKTWQRHRLLWKALRGIAFLSGLVFQKKTSRLRTYNLFRILGISFRKKRKRSRR
ncbi:MAG: glycosyltransferase family 8 protein [Oxalobacter formigenes]|nr:glycosyltransferase family 8 protein [Oxalobacter formigenes]